MIKNRGNPNGKIVKNFLKKWLGRQEFFPGFLGILIHPFYFARKELCNSIQKLAFHISGKILDVGCGQKPYQELFHYKVYVGMDLEQSIHNHKDGKIDVFYDGKKFPFQSETFDSVISNEVLEHVFNPDEHLAEINRVLKMHGRLLITVPFLWDEHEQPHDFARYSSFGLRNLLERNGFEIIEQKKTCADIRAVFQLLNVYVFKKTLWLRKGFFRYFVTLCLNAPLTVLGEILNVLLPKNFDLYLDNVILAGKRQHESPSKPNHLS